MKYQKAFDITTLLARERAAIQRGQWVYTHGDPKTLGQYMGPINAAAYVVRRAPTTKATTTTE